MNTYEVFALVSILTLILPSTIALPSNSFRSSELALADAQTSSENSDAGPCVNVSSYALASVNLRIESSSNSSTPFVEVMKQLPGKFLPRTFVGNSTLALFFQLNAGEQRIILANRSADDLIDMLCTLDSDPRSSWLMPSATDGMSNEKIQQIVDNLSNFRITIDVAHALINTIGERPDFNYKTDYIVKILLTFPNLPYTLDLDDKYSKFFPFENSTMADGLLRHYLEKLPTPAKGRLVLELYKIREARTAVNEGHNSRANLCCFLVLPSLNLNSLVNCAVENICKIPCPASSLFDTLNTTSDSELKDLPLSSYPSDDLAKALSLLPQTRQQVILNLLDPQQRAEVVKVLPSHPVDKLCP